LEEQEFRDKLVSDLQLSGINVVNMRAGTFDLIIEGKRPFVCEVKRITSKGLRGFQENEKGFKFSKEQTSEILKMKFPPFVVAFHQKECYFLEPDWVARALRTTFLATCMKSLRTCPLNDGSDNLA
jgi:hypothetical protein